MKFYSRIDCPKPSDEARALAAQLVGRSWRTIALWRCVFDKNFKPCEVEVLHYAAPTTDLYLVVESHGGEVALSAISESRAEAIRFYRNMTALLDPTGRGAATAAHAAVTEQGTPDFRSYQRSNAWVFGLAVDGRRVPVGGPYTERFAKRVAANLNRWRAILGQPSDLANFQVNTSRESKGVET